MKLFRSRNLDSNNSGTISKEPIHITGKSLSEALIFSSTNPQYDNRLLIVHENYELRIPAEHVVYTNCLFCFVLTFSTTYVHNMFYPCSELGIFMY